MVLQCLTWFPHLWSQLVCPVSIHKKGFVRPFPEDIIIDILSRLPADDILECRKVCKQWLELTSTPSFTELHCKRSSPVLFVQYVDYTSMAYDQLDLFMFDEGAKKDKKVKKMTQVNMHLRRPNMPLLFGSCNGLLVFRSMLGGPIYFVCNPVTREERTLRPPVYSGALCGLFFDPLRKDYNYLLLFVKQLGNHFEYSILSLGGKLYKKLDTLSYLPRRSVAPTVLKRSLHWMVESRFVNEHRIPCCRKTIMMFNMDTEGFSSMPHPGKECHSRRLHGKMHLLEMKGKLSFGYIIGRLIDIWVLEDYENWFWLKKYKVDLNWDVRLYPFECTQFFPDEFNSKVTLLSIQNDELILCWFSRGFFRYNLCQNTVNKIDGVGTKRSALLPSYRLMTAYEKTFISLRDFK